MLALGFGLCTVCTRLLRSHESSLHQTRRAPHLRRSHERHGPHRLAARMGAGRRGAGHPDHRKRAGWWLCTRRWSADWPRIVDALDKGTGAFSHGQTYQGHPLACAAALEVQRIIREDGLVENVRKMGQLLSDLLRQRLSQHPNVGDIRGRGLFWGVSQNQSKYMGGRSMLILYAD